MTADLLARKETSFVLWHVGNTTPVPSLIVGQVKPGAPLTFIDKQEFPLTKVPGFPDLWEISATKCNLKDGEVYHYWFEVTVSHPDANRAGKRLRVTDPTAYMVDWRLTPFVDPPFNDDDRYPPAVIKCAMEDGVAKLVATDLGGEEISFPHTTKLETLPTNNQLVIYELPTTWSRSSEVGGRNMGVGTFLDVAALIEKDLEAPDFSELDVVQKGKSYLTELGINALELLPPADSTYNRQWGYGTTNYLAPDFELGLPSFYSWSTPNRDLAKLIDICHTSGIRFFVDTVMAFSKNNPYLAVACDDFFILDPSQAKSDPDAHNSRGKDDNNLRNGYGASLFRYAKMLRGYDPISGKVQTISPGRQLMKTALTRWMNDFHIDGLRLDSIENVYNWDFIQEYKDLARELNRLRFAVQGASGAEERFLVVGEELSEPKALLSQQRLDGLWHQSFKDYIRMALIGRHHESEPWNFAETVRKAIDCRRFGYSDLTQAILYLTSHDVEGYRNERLYNFFQENGVSDCEKRFKLAFTCLLTAVGIPMILAGDEFADQHNLFDAKGNVNQEGGKQVDPVHFGRLADPWRKNVKDYVSRLIKFRTSYDALAVNDTDFLHVDLNDNKRVLVWRRGRPNSDKQVVVVANFSDFITSNAESPGAEYFVHNWPATPPGKHWYEVSQNDAKRLVDSNRVGREPIYSWEAKVYVLF